MISDETFRAVTALLVIWLMVLVALVMAGALALWPTPRTRTLMLLWSTGNVAPAVQSGWRPLGRVCRSEVR